MQDPATQAAAGPKLRRRINTIRAAIRLAAIRLAAIRLAVMGPAGSVGRARLTGAADQFVGLDQHVIAVRLRAGKKADRDKRRAEQKTHQHDLSMSTLVGIMKRRRHDRSNGQSNGKTISPRG